LSVARQGGTGIDVGAQILSRAADYGPDLIVMGGYGHTRIRG
jgi:nucleotide-binding universal stress UspA family protein